ncbi:TetR/AcrR family transcriptional regulator [Microbacterium karelineae]|uniref:TetR/AcrR family transcriptional regulator n=1 Tax=Microbacterium karelineae TaxID=2654283 RepID=UPI0012EA013A|nr:TetR family transcriptional regulator [Microbacterium karelineae]
MVEQRAAAPESGLRDRKKQATRRSLEETAVRLFLERGFADTTLDELVTEVGVSKRTFFRHFASKEDVAMSAESELWEAFAEAIGSRDPQAAILDGLRASLRSAVEGLDDDWDRRFVAVRGLMARTPALWDRSIVHAATARRRIAAALDDGRVDDADARMRVALLSEFAVAAWRCAARDWIAGRGRPDGKGPRQRLGAWRGPGGRAGLLSSIDRAFDEIPASLGMSV